MEDAGLLMRLSPEFGNHRIFFSLRIPPDMLMETFLSYRPKLIPLEQNIRNFYRSVCGWRIGDGQEDRANG